MDLKELALQAGQRRHPWEISRAAFFRSQLAGLAAGGQAMEVMDIGCGDAWLAQDLIAALPQGSRILCIDQSFTPDLIARLQPSSAAIKMYQSAPQNSKASAVLLLDVLEHVENDSAFLKQIVDQQLAPQGWLVASVPAYSFLFSEHDRWLGHFRRYSPAAARELLKSAGLEVVREGGLFFSLLFVRLLQKVLPSSGKATGVGQWQGGPLTTSILVRILNFDWRMAGILRAIGISLPGLSWWCICRKA